MPSVLPPAPAGPRPDPRAAAAPSRRARPGRRRVHRGAHVPVRRTGRTSTRSGCGRRRPPRAGAAWPTRCPPRSPRLRTTLLPGLLAAPGATSAAGRRRRRCSRPGSCSLPPPRPRPPPTAGRPAPRRPTSSPPSTPRCPTSRCTSPSVLAGRASSRGLVGRGARPAPGPTRSESPAASPTRCGVDARGPAGDAAGPWHPGRCARAARRRAWSSGTPASCTRGCARASACPPRRGRGLDLDALIAAAPVLGRHAVVLDHPGRQGGRRARRRRRGAGGRGRGRAARGRRRAARVGPALRRLHRRAGGRRAAVRWPSRCGSGRRTAPSPRRRSAPPATPRSPRRPVGPVPPCAPDPAHHLTRPTTWRRPPPEPAHHLTPPHTTTQPRQGDDQVCWWQGACLLAVRRRRSDGLRRHQAGAQARAPVRYANGDRAAFPARVAR